MKMDALELLLTRESALKLESPGPSEADLEVMIQSALRAPDHGRLRPWQFVVIQEGNRVAFGELCQPRWRGATQRPRPRIWRASRQGDARTGYRGGGCEIGQRAQDPRGRAASVGGAAVQNIMLAANARGFGAMWKTGAPAYDASVKQALGIAPDSEIVGFLYLGTQVGGGIRCHDQCLRIMCRCGQDELLSLLPLLRARVGVAVVNPFPNLSQFGGSSPRSEGQV